MKNRANWLYFLCEMHEGKDKDKVKKAFFLYGNSLPTEHEEKEEDPKTLGKVGNKKIQCWYSINALDYSEEIMNFKSIHSVLDHSISVIAKKSVVQLSIDVDQKNPESLFHAPVDVDVYYTDEIAGFNNGFYFKPEGMDELVKILEILKKETGQSFKGAYSKRLGAFEYVKTKPWSENKVTPFTISIDPRGQKEPHRYFFERSDEFLNEELLVHLVVYDNDNEVLFDQLRSVKSFEKKIFFEPLIHNNDGGYEYWVFDKDGRLLDRDKKVFIKSISFGLNLLGNQYAISKENLSKKSPLKEGSVGIISLMSNNQIDFRNQDKIREVSDRAKDLHQRINEYFSGSNQNSCRWFKKNNDQEEFKKYLNQITHFQKCEAWIIDQYFCFDPVKKEYSTDYLFFLQNSSLDLRVISCFSGADRDKADKLKPLQDFNMPLSKMTWRNLSNGKFHDRFIYVKGKNGSNAAEDVYMLSNSFNNILKDYDICIVRLDGEAKRKATIYIKSLITESETSGDVIV